MQVRSNSSYANSRPYASLTNDVSATTLALLSISQTTSPATTFSTTSILQYQHAEFGKLIHSSTRTTSSANGTKTLVNKNVTFHPKITGKYFTATSKDLQEAWYSPEDFRIFEENAKADVKLLRRILKNPVENLYPNEMLALEQTPSRGIEQYLSKRKCYDRTNKQRALIQTVLAKQQYHRAQSSEPLSPSVLALVSSAHSLEARRRALECGIRDEEAAVKVYKTCM